MVKNIAKLIDFHCTVLHILHYILCIFFNLQSTVLCICVYDDGAVAVCHEILASLTTSFRRELAQIIARILTSNGNESFSSSLLWVEAHRNPSSSSSWVLGQRRWVRLGVKSIVYVHFWYFMYIFIKNTNVYAPARRHLNNVWVFEWVQFCLHSDMIV